MQNDFEKEISRRMQELQIAPQPQVWQQVEAALPPEKKRRPVVIWWWLLPLAFCLGTGIWLTTGKSNKNASAKTEPVAKNTVRKTGNDSIAQSAETLAGTTSATTTAIKNNEENKPIPGNKNKALQSVPVHLSAPENNNAVANKEIPEWPVQKPNQKKNLQIPDSYNLFSAIPVSGNKRAVDTVEKDNFETALDPVIKSGKDSDEKAVITDTSALLRAMNTNKKFIDTTEPTDSVKKIKIAKAAVDQHIDSSKSKPGETEAIASINHKAGNNNTGNKIEWRAEAGIGISWNETSNYRIDRAQNFGTSTSSGIYTSSGANTFLAGKSGISFSAGISRRQYFTRHWNWNLGMHYQLLTSGQATGGSTANSSLLDNSVTASYVTGSSATRQSQTHQVQLMPGMGYTFFPQAPFSVTLYGSLILGYNYSSNQLLFDYRNDRYIRSSTYLNRFFFAPEAGVEVSRKRKFYLGLRYQHSLSNIAKAALQSDVRWRQIQFYAGFTFFSHH